MMNRQARCASSSPGAVVSARLCAAERISYLVGDRGAQLSEGGELLALDEAGAGGLDRLHLGANHGALLALTAAPFDDVSEHEAEQYDRAAVHGRDEKSHVATVHGKRD